MDIIIVKKIIILSIINIWVSEAQVIVKVKEI